MAVIVRKVLEDESLVESLDFYNDGTDTILWLRSRATDRSMHIADRIEQAMDEWMQRHFHEEEKPKAGE